MQLSLERNRETTSHCFVLYTLWILLKVTTSLSKASVVMNDGCPSLTRITRIHDCWRFDSCNELWDTIFDLNRSGTSYHVNAEGILCILLASWQTSDGNELIGFGTLFDEDVDGDDGTICDGGKFIPHKIWSMLMSAFVASVVALSSRAKLLLRMATLKDSIRVLRDSPRILKDSSRIG